MALQIWLPLNKNDDLKNQGLANVTVTNNGATYNSNGKIGGCYSFSNNYLLIQNTPLSSSTVEFSISAWVYITSLANSYGPIYNSRTATSGAGIVFWLTGSGFRLDDGSMWEVSYGHTLNSWEHVCWTRGSGKNKIYVNGSLIYTSSSVGNLSGVAATAYIAKDLQAPSTYYINGKLNDFRLYNHCLSAQEVKEISKGLVLHYPLNESSLATTGNLITGLTLAGLTTVSGGTVTISGNNSDTYFYIKTSRALTSGKMYRLSCVGSGFADNTQYNFPIGAQNNASPGLLYIKNGYCELIFIANDTIANAGTNIILDDSGRSNAHSGSVKDFLLVEYNGAVDSSGYNNNGTITGTLTLSNDTPRYDKCTLFDGVNSIIKGSLSLADDYKYTASFWYKPTTINSGTQWVFAIGSGNNHLFGCYVNNEQIVTQVGGVVGSSVTGWTKSLTANTLYHIAITCDGANTKVYVDGDLLGTAAKNGTTAGNVFWIGLRPGAPGNYNLNGKLSDFRIYATALSADDVKDLYQEAAFIDNKGDVSCYLFYEDGANSKELLPIPTSGVTFNSDGSYLVNGHIYPPTDYIPINPSGKTYYYDIEYSNLNSGNHLYIGFEKYDINKASGSNNECLYLVSTTSVTNHTRVTGTIGLATANGTTAAFTKLRILNNWDGASGTNQAIIHHISLKEVSTLTLNQINKQGLIKSDLFIEADSATVSKYGNITANQLIEI